MSNTDEIRWQQRFDNFTNALARLENADRQEKYSDLERAGLVQMFEFSFELAWKTLKDLLFYEGFDVKSPREVIRKSFEMEYLDEVATETLLDAMKKRTLLSHVYEEKMAENAVSLIKERYLPVLKELQTFLTAKRQS